VTNASDRDRKELLLESSGMVTELLEALFNEPVDAERLRHESFEARADNPINLDEGCELLHRAALLRGRVTRRPYLYAESLIACDRLPQAVTALLRKTDTPLGRALLAQDLVFRRKMLGPPRSSPMSSDEQLLNLIRSVDAKRSYQILIDDVPVVAVDEWFLPAALDSALPFGRV
jgi:chorismate-pyruvate lyase